MREQSFNASLVFPLSQLSFSILSLSFTVCLCECVVWWSVARETALYTPGAPISRGTEPLNNPWLKLKRNKGCRSSESETPY